MIENTPKHIRIWAWKDAPEELKALSRNGGDEDWIALLPPNFLFRDVCFLDEGTRFGCFSVEEHEHPELPGYRIRIGCHS